MLKMTRINLELIMDVDMHQFIERGTRGGISVITHRYAKANNPYMKFYNPENDTSYIMYLDANNLYGWAMVRPLPYGGFRWVEPKHYTEKEEGIGYIGNCEEELPKKPVGRLSVNCRPSVDRQVTDSLPTVNQQVTDRLRKKENCGKHEQLT